MSSVRAGVRTSLAFAIVTASVLAAGTASAGWDSSIVTVEELEAGAMFLSEDGGLAFTDFEFNAVGFDESRFDEFLVQPRSDGFRLILGFGDLFGPGSLEFRYTVTALSGQISSAGLPLLFLYDTVGPTSPLVTAWAADNGAALSGSSADLVNFPTPGVSTSFAPTVSLLVEQALTLEVGTGIAKLDVGYKRVPSVPEPSTALLLGMALVAAAALGRRY